MAPNVVGQGRTLEMFDKPQPPRQWRMHVVDAGDCEDEDFPIMARLGCQRCGHETEWLQFATVTEAKRGLPCPKCNGSACDHKWRDDGKRLELVCAECGARHPVGEVSGPAAERA